MSDQTEKPYPPKQLSMTVRAEKVLKLPDVTLQENYVLRGYRPGDEDSWVDLLKMGSFSTWDRSRIDTFLADSERREGSRVVSLGDKIVAATFASRRESSDKIGVLDFVISHPEHRGCGLGRAVCTSVSKFLIDKGYQSVNLHTDDWRLEAINLYLSLGFVPDMTRDDMPSRWDVIMKKLEAMQR